MISVQPTTRTDGPRSTSLEGPPAQGFIPPTREALLNAAAVLGQRWEEHELQINADAHIPQQLAHDAASAGLMTMSMPDESGDPAVDLMTMVDVVAVATDHVPALGWNIMVAQGAGFLGWANLELRDHLATTATRPPIVACALAATGTGTRTLDGDGFVISGRWFIVSGCQNADWLIAAFGVTEDGRELEWGEGGVRFAVIDMTQVRVVENWDVLGLRGTGSHDVVVDNVTVSERCTFNPFHDTSPNPAVNYHVSYFSYLMAMMAGPVLGMTNRIMRLGEESLSNGNDHLDPADSLRLFRLTAETRAAAAGVRQALSALCYEVANNGAAHLSTRAHFVGSVQHAERVMQRAVVDLMVWSRTPHSSLGGLAAAQRDADAIGQHLAYSLVTEHRMADHLYAGETRLPFMI